MTIDLDVLPKQHEFITADEHEVMYSGAVRAGKTYCLCLDAVIAAHYPRSRVILCRKTLPALKGTTLKTLLEGDGDNPPVLPPGTYTHNKVEKEIKIHGGGSILYFSLVNDGAEGVQQRAGSYSGCRVYIDEATELDDKDYRMMLSRASIKHAKVGIQVKMACNPGAPSHHLAKRFAPPGSGYMEPMKNCRCISTRTTDNFFLSPEYIAGLERDAGTLWYRRFVEGLWCGSEGVVYDRWDRLVHVVEQPGPHSRYVIGVDDGYSNPFAALLIGVDGDGRASVIREVHQSNLELADRVKAVLELAAGRKVEAVLIDPSAPDVIKAMQNAKLPAQAALNDVLPGINCVQSRLVVCGDGRPRLTVDPSCQMLLREMESYSWKPDRPKDEPVKKHDHACDALRYAMMYLDNGYTFALGVAGGDSKPQRGSSKWDDWD